MGNFLKFLGITDEQDDYEEEIYEETEEHGNNVISLNRARRRNTSTQQAAESTPVTPSAAVNKMIVYHPISYEDTQNIIDNLKSRKPVIVNMEELDIDCAQRILDFMAGAIYALSGTIYKINRGIYIVAPANYSIIGSEDGDEGSY